MKKKRKKHIGKKAEILYKRYNKKVCFYCGSTENLTVDHLIPISRFREVKIRRKILDNKSNKIISCAKCNHEKGDMLPCDWFRMHPEYKKNFRRHAKYISDEVKKIVNLYEKII